MILVIFQLPVLPNHTNSNSNSTSSSANSLAPNRLLNATAATAAVRPALDQPLIKTLLSTRFHQTLQRACSGEAEVTSQDDKQTQSSQDDDVNRSFTSVETDSATEAGSPVLQNGVHALLQKPAAPAPSERAAQVKVIDTRPVNGFIANQNGFASDSTVEKLNGSHARSSASENFNSNNNNNANAGDDSDTEGEDDASANTGLSETIAVFQSAMTDIHHHASTSHDAAAAEGASTSQEHAQAATHEVVPGDVVTLQQEPTVGLPQTQPLANPQTTCLQMPNPSVQVAHSAPLAVVQPGVQLTAVVSQNVVTSLQQSNVATVQVAPGVQPAVLTQAPQLQPQPVQVQAPVTQLNLPQQVLSVQNQLVQHLSGQIAAQTVAPNTQQLATQAAGNLLQNISPQLVQQLLQAAALHQQQQQPPQQQVLVQQPVAQQVLPQLVTGQVLVQAPQQPVAPVLQPNQLANQISLNMGQVMQQHVLVPSVVQQATVQTAAPIMTASLTSSSAVQQPQQQLSGIRIITQPPVTSSDLSIQVAANQLINANSAVLQSSKASPVLPPPQPQRMSSPSVMSPPPASPQSTRSSPGPIPSPGGGRAVKRPPSRHSDSGDRPKKPRSRSKASANSSAPVTPSPAPAPVGPLVVQYVCEWSGCNM